MRASSFRWRPVLCVTLAALCAAGTWIYAKRVLIPGQRPYVLAHDMGRGNHSDLYPRWLGSRELLLHRRDPYTMEFTGEIQRGFYGRLLDRPDDPGEGHEFQQGFYYPAYVALLLAPTIDLPFSTAQKIFVCVMAVLVAAMIPCWLYVLRWPLPLWSQATIFGLALASLPIMQGLKLQQMTLLVVPLLAGAVALLVAERPVAAGILLALATIKPQLVWLVLLWLAMWTLADWRRRYRWAASFGVSMIVLCAAAAWFLPDWIWRFWNAIRQYHKYTGEMSVTQLQMGYPWSRIVEFIVLAVTIVICWRMRREAAGSEAFGFAVSLVLATTVFVVPTYGLYNQALLLPALLLTMKERRAIWSRSLANRILCVVMVAVFTWPWVWCTGLAVLSFVLPVEMVERAHQAPLWTSLATPLVVAGAMLSWGWQRTFAAARETTAS